MILRPQSGRKALSVLSGVGRSEGRERLIGWKTRNGVCGVWPRFLAGPLHTVGADEHGCTEGSVSHRRDKTENGLQQLAWSKTLSLPKREDVSGATSQLSRGEMPGVTQPSAPSEQEKLWDRLG